KLVGALGTFGVPGGSELARELEFALATDVTGEDAPRLAELVLALGREVERGPAPSTPGGPRAAAPTPGGPEAADLLPLVSEPPLLVLSSDETLSGRLLDEGVALGLRVVVVGDAAEAAARVDREPPSAILVDLGGTPPDDALVELLERLGRSTSPLPVHAVGAGAGLATRVELTRLGVRSIMPRALTPAAMLGSVERALAAPTALPPHVLVLDDDPDELHGTCRELEADGVVVDGTGDPGAFWQLLERAAPDLVVLALDAHSVSADDVCRVLRADARFAQLPVVIMSSRSDEASIERSIVAGADDHLCRPQAASRLRGLVRHRIGHGGAGRGHAGDVDPATGVPGAWSVSDNLVRLGSMADRHGVPLCVAVVQLDPGEHGEDGAVLRRLGGLLVRAFRGEDALGSWGSEQFLVGLYGATAAIGARRLEDVLVRFRALEQSVSQGSGPVATFSAGLAQHRVHATGAQELSRSAGDALSRARRHGPGLVVSSQWRAPVVAGEIDVLVVEDDPALRDVLEHVLRARGLTYALLEDGRAAVEALDGPVPSLRPRVVLLDVDLPGLDGLSVLRHLGRVEALGALRVIMLTARAGEADVLEALELGALDHVAKPFSAPILMHRIERALATA
ncbi:MAG: response regulator, partial [Solirubrobacterales bacterium]|nr:response regulator [Solirubrobacterales bacterium]